MASTKRPRESLEDKCDGVDTFNHQENVDRRTGLETKSQRRRSSCVRGKCMPKLFCFLLLLLLFSAGRAKGVVLC